MKKLLLSTAALGALTASAMAADLPSRRAPPPAYVAVPVFTWTGFYVGANAGYGWSENTNRNFLGGNGTNLTAIGPTGVVTGVTPVPGSFFGNANGSNERDGFVGGGQIGYNYQIGQFVVGVEADIQYADFGNGRGNGVFGTAVPNANIGGVVPGAPGNVAFFNDGNRMDWFGTVRGRIGYAMDRWMIYGTGGLAFRDTEDRRDVIAPTFFTAAAGGGGIGIVGARRGENTGYAVGGGLEYAFTPNLTAKIEGLYVNFDDKGRNGRFTTNTVVGVTNTGADIVQAGARRNHEDDFAVVRAGINYKFNGF